MNRKLVALAAIFTLGTASFASATAAATHEVEPGESLWSISQQYDMTVEELTELNELESNSIYPEQQLHIDQDGTAYLIEPGDSLYNIAIEHHVTVDELTVLNELSSDLIVAGETLAVTGSAVTKKETQQQSKSQTKTANKKSASAQTTSTQPTNEGKTLTMEATAYTAYCEGCSGVTANGTDLRANPSLKVIAVDPSVIPLGTKVWVEGYGEAIAADTGGAIKGNKIDLFMADKSDAYEWGRKTVTLKVIN